MKRTALLLSLTLTLLCLLGCRDTDVNNYRFYYLRTSDSIVYGQAEALVAPVDRQISGRSPELSYLLQLYLEGPSEEGFENPLPEGTRLIRVRQDGTLLVMEVTTHFSSLENIQLTLTGACLTATCYELAGAETVQVLCGEKSYQFYRSDYTFFDVIDTQSGKDNQ